MKETKTPSVKKKPSREKPLGRNKILIHYWWMRGTSESVHEWDQGPPLEEKNRRFERQSQRWKTTKI